MMKNLVCVKKEKKPDRETRGNRCRVRGGPDYLTLSFLWTVTYISYRRP